MIPAGCLATADLAGLIAEVKRLACSASGAFEPAVQARLGRSRQQPRELQPAAFRSAVGAVIHRRQPADHLPRVDRRDRAPRAAMAARW